MRTGVIFILFLFIGVGLFAQTPGLIIKPAQPPGNGVLDPNGDGYTSKTSAGFPTGTNDFEAAYTELVFTDLVRPDPIGDPRIGPTGRFNDIVGFTGLILGDHAIQTALIGGNFIVRFRMDNFAPNSKAYSIFIDTDQKFGFTGDDADPNAVAGNPGFELEVALLTNFTVNVYNINGTTTPAIISTYSYDTHAQKSIALSENSSSPDYFYDYYVPFADLGVAVDAGLRFVAVTSMNPHPSMGNNAISDVGGYTTTGGLDAQFEELIGEQTPTPAGQTVIPRSACPTITAPILTGAQSVSGTTSEGSGTTIRLYVDDVLVGSVVTTSSAWTISGLSALTSAASVKATAQATGKGVSYSSCNLNFVGSSCTAPPTNVATIQANKGVSLNVTGPVGTIVTLYGPNSDTETIIYKKDVPDDNNPFTTTSLNQTNVIIKGTIGQALLDGVYYVRSKAPGECASSKVYVCVGDTYLATATPTVNTVLPLSSTITGTGGVANATLSLFSNGTLLANKALTASGAWSVSVPSAAICNVTITAQQVAPGFCMSAISNSVIVGSAVTSKPTLTVDTCATSVSTVTGLSGEADGTIIQVYVNGVLRAGTATVTNGTWSFPTTPAITTGQTITARATNAANCKTVSAFSVGRTIGGTTAYSGNFSITSTVYEGATSVPVIVSGTSGTYKLYLFIDGDTIGSRSFSANGTVNVPIVYASDVYTGGVLKVALKQGIQCLSSLSDTLAIVQCNLPSFASSVISTPATSKCVATSGVITLTNSQSLVVYTPVDNLGATKGYSVLGNGGTISLNTYPFPSSGPATFYLKAQRIVSSGGCTVTSTGSVTFNAYNSPQFVSHPTSHIACSGASTILSAAWTGVGPYNIQWQYDNGGGYLDLAEAGVYSQTSATGTAATSATLYISDAATLDGVSYRCVVTDTGIPSECQISNSDGATLTVILVNISSSTVVNATSGNNGSINITASGGDGNYSYDWHHINGAGTFGELEDLTGLAAGTYTVTVMDGNGCTFEQSFVVGGVGSINLAFNSKTNITCYGAANGQFTVTASTGTSPYSYSINNFASSQASGTFSSLTPGTYTVVARDASFPVKESNSVAITIEQPLEMVVYSTKSNASLAQNDGSIFTTVVGGTTPLNYVLYRNGTSVSTVSNTTLRTMNFPNLTAATYSVTVSDSNACTATKAGILITAPDSVKRTCTHTASHYFNTPQNTYSGYSDPTYNLFKTNWVETGDDAGGLATSGNIRIYNEALAFGHIPSSNGDLTWTTSPSISRTVNLLGASNITVKYKFQCDGAASTDNYTVTFYVNNISKASYLINTNKQNATQDSVTFTGITYNTTAANPTNTFKFGLSSGNGKSNFRIDDFVITFNRNLSAGVTTTPATCTNGTVDLSVAGGYTPYTYDWDNDGDTIFNDPQDLSGLAANTYKVYVKDSTGCTSTQISAIVASAPLAVSITGTNPTCAGGGANGTITDTLTSPGTGGPITIKLIKGATDTIATAITAAPKYTFTGLATGVYTVKVWQAANNCSAQPSGPVTLSLPTMTAALSAVGPTTICNGGSTSVKVTISGGTSPYVVVLSNGQTISGYYSETAIPVTPSGPTLSITSVTGSLSCVSGSNGSPLAFTIRPKPSSTISGGGAVCSGSTRNLSIALTGTANWNLTYAINGVDQPSVGPISSSPYVFAVGTAGTYTVTALSDAYCTGTTFNGSPLVSVNPLPVVTIDSYNNPNCADDPDGSIDITTTNGTGSYTYVWNNGTSNFSTAEDLTGLSAATYTVTATDGNSCVGTKSQSLSYYDDVAPVISGCPGNYSISTNGSTCVGNLNPDDPTATDNCNISTPPALTWVMDEPVLGISSGSNSIGNRQFQVGLTTITYTATDASSNTSTCTFTVTVADNTAPSAVCQNITAYVDANGDVTITPDEIDNESFDDCALTPTLDLSNDGTNYYSSLDYSCSDLGPNTVYLRVSDGTNSATCTSTVTVADNNIVTTSLAVSDATSCNPAPGDVEITISNSETNVNYELKTSGGVSLSPAVTGAGNGGDLVLTILQANAPTSTTTYRVDASLACSTFTLTDVPTVSVPPNPSITLDTAPEVCEGDNSANLNYTTTSGSPDQYSINWNASALSEGFSNESNTLTTSPITISVSASAQGGTYSGTLYVTNTTTGCVSSGTPVNVNVEYKVITPQLIKN